MNSRNEHNNSTKDTVIKCRVTTDFKKRLDEYCKENHTTKSKVIVKGVEAIIKK